MLPRLTRAAFRAAGLEVHRYGRRMRTSMEDSLAHVARLGFRPATVIDVGVGHGTAALYEAFPTANVLLVEPLEEFTGVLQELVRRYGGEYVLGAAGSRSGRRIIHVRPYLEGSSFFRETGAPEKDGVPREVPVVTLDDVVSSRNLTGPHLLKADVQGAELDVLDGATTVLQDSGVVILEVSLFQFVEGAPEMHDVVAYMKDRGFVVYDIFGGHLRPLDGALAQVDIAFVQEHGWFRRSHRFAAAGQ